MEKKFDNILKGEKVECSSCKKGYFVTDAPNVEKANIFRCSHCGKILEFVPAIDLRDL